MALVYAQDPSAAFAMNANLDQQRVQNYLNSVAANRQSQLSGWNAAAQQAAAQQAQEQQQQNLMLNLAQHAMAQRQAADQFQQNLGYSRDRLAEDLRSHLADEAYKTAALGKVNASEDTLQWNKQKEAQNNADLAVRSENIAKYLDEHAALTTMLKQIPTTAAEQSTAMDKQLSGIPFDWNSLNPFASTRTPQAETVIKQKIASSVPSYLNPNWEGAKTVADFAEVAKTALDRRIKALDKFLPKTEAELNAYVTFQNGSHIPNFRVNPLLGGVPVASPQTLTPAISPAASADGIREDYRNGKLDRDTAIQALKALGYQ